MKKILVVYYSQSGQLRQILDSILRPLQGQTASIDFAQIRPVQDYPFPWGDVFFESFPESVMDIPCPLNPLDLDSQVTYDLVILGYQSWFLSPSIPFSSFLKSEQAAGLLNKTPVITVCGVRNMWVEAQEIVKRKLKKLDARLVGNIVLQDRHNNWIAGLTIIRWLINGRKEAGSFLPEAGVSKIDIEDASRFGQRILEHLNTGDYANMQEELVRDGAVEVRFHLMQIEHNARRIFVKFAAPILRKGKNGRKARITLVRWYIVLALFLLSPVFSLLFRFLRWLIYPLASRRITYAQGIQLS